MFQPKRASKAAMLTERQREVLSFIEQCIADRGYPPTLREIGEKLQIRSTNGVNDHLRALERKGYLTREDLKSRALRPTSASAVASIPVVGQVAAGQPSLAVEEAEQTLRIDCTLVGSDKEIFGLRVRGDSMIEDGIFEGDYVFVRRSGAARSGDTVVVRVDDEATVKRYYPEGQRIRLQPANQAMQPIYLDREHGREVEIMGVVVGVYRKLSA